MTTRQSRRKLIVVVLLLLAVTGAAIRHFAAPGTTTRDIGTLMLLLWIPVIGNVVGWLMARLKRPPKPAPAPLAEAAAAAGASIAKALETPFRAHLRCDITLRPAAVPAEDLLIAEGEHFCAFVVGKEGFSGRWQVPAGGAFRRGTTQRLPIELLSPAVALPRLTPGTAFRMLVGEAFIGDGRVVGTLDEEAGAVSTTAVPAAATSAS